jgi:hypothetical protein
VKINNTVITPALSLDPQLLCQTPEDEAAFRKVLSGSSIGQAKSFGSSRLYMATDILEDLGTVADLFFKATNGGKEIVSLLGGYAFLDGEHFLFGAESAYPFHKEWEIAFRRLERSSPVDVVVDQAMYKLIRKDHYLVVYHRDAEFAFPVETFVRCAAEAVVQNQNLKNKLASHLQLRFAGAENDLLKQLL